MSSEYELQVISTFTISTMVAAAFPLLSIYISYPGRIKSDIATISAGIFLGAIFLSLIDETRKEEAVPVFIIGFVIGAIVFSISNHFLKRDPKYDLSTVHIATIEVIINRMRTLALLPTL